MTLYIKCYNYKIKLFFIIIFIVLYKYNFNKVFFVAALQDIILVDLVLPPGPLEMLSSQYFSCNIHQVTKNGLTSEFDVVRGVSGHISVPTQNITQCLV